MTPEDLRADIPILSETAYLNWGASGPSPERVVDAGESTLESHEFVAPGEEGMYPNADGVFAEARTSVAEFIGTNPESVALTQSTTDGINRVATAMEWEAGDRIISTDIEHPAGRLPWQRLERHTGVEPHILETERGQIDLERLDDALSDARLLCVSAIDWLYGRSHPVEEMVELAHEHGTRVLVDAVQMPGQRPLDVEQWGADFVAGSGHKWLLGPWGSGFLSVSESVAEDLEPGHIGYRSVTEPTADTYELQSDARRFEVGTMNPATYAGLDAAIGTMESVGLATIQDRIAELTDHLKAGVPVDRLRSPVEYESGLVTLRTADPDHLVESLSSESIRIRSLPLPESVRVSIHAVNTEAEVDRLLDHLAERW